MGVAYNSKIVTDGLVLCLDAANRKSYPGTGTTWTDLSGNGRIVTFNNMDGTNFNSANLGSLTFDSTNEFVTVSMVNPFAETIIVWAKSATSNWNQNGWISSSRAQNGHIIHPNSGTRDVYYYVGNSTGVGFDGEINFYTPGDITIPHMYSYTTNGSNLHKGYFDGTEVVSKTTSITRTTSPSNQVWHLGKDDSFNRFGNGNIYACLRYNRALTATEIAQNYNALKSRYI